MRRAWPAFLIFLASSAADPWHMQGLFAETIDPLAVDVKTEQHESQPGQNPPGKQLFFSREDAAGGELQVLKSPKFIALDQKGNERARDLGFESAAEIAEAKLGSPLPVRRVGLKQLSNFNKEKNDDPNELLVDTHTSIYPVEVKGAVRSSLTVSQSGKEGTWRWMKRGAPHLISQIERFRTADTSFILFIPGFHLHFLGSGSGNNLMLTPISPITLDGLDLKAGQALSAREMFFKLSPVASKMLDRPDRKKRNR